ncbi:recombination protein F [Corynebacterium aquatimens]|nr:recombination protein F [Corynebacterium aquatimens]
MKTGGISAYSACMPRFPIKSVDVANFGPFAHVQTDFSKDVNIIVGENGTGKTQFLKLLYACTSVIDSHDAELTKTVLSRAIADRLKGTFKPDALGRLVSRVQGQQTTSVKVKYAGIGEPLAFGFHTTAKTEVKVASIPNSRLEDTAVFLPSRELLSIYEGLANLFDTVQVPFDETWRDTARLLERKPLLGARSENARQLITPLLEALEGNVVEEKGRFYVKRAAGDSTTSKLEAHLVSEGHRKLAMIVRLVQSGVLLDGGYLFWDEPEANLNPKTQRAVAQAICTLAMHGTQVFVATHSVFMLRELRMLLENNEGVTSQYIGLVRSAGSAGVVAESGAEQSDLSIITALEEEGNQALRYLGV